MPRNRSSRHHGYKHGLSLPPRSSNEQHAAEAARPGETQTPTEDSRRQNQQASDANTSGRAPEPVSTTSHRHALVSYGSNHRYISSPRGNGSGGSRPAQKHQHGRPHDAEGRRQDKVSRRSKLSMVPELEWTNWANPQGESGAAGVVNSRLDRDPHVPSGFVMQSNVANHAAHLLVTNDNSSHAANDPIDDDVARARKERELNLRIESSWDQPRPKLRLPRSYFVQGPPRADDSTPATEPASESTAEPERVADIEQYRCANCGQPGHNIDRCIQAVDGYILGCTICRSMSHCIDECNIFLGLSLQLKIKLLVCDRSSMPPLKTKVHWFQWLCDWLSHPDSRDGNGFVSVPSGLPWSEVHTRNIGRGHAVDIQALQEAFDQHQDVALLPKDPATLNYGAAYETYGRDHMYPNLPI